MRPRGLEESVALPQGRFGVVVVAADCRPGRPHRGGGEAGVSQAGRGTHPLRQQFGEQCCQAKGLEFIRQRPARERLCNRLIARQRGRRGSNDIRVALDAANPARSSDTEGVGLRGESVVPWGGHDSQAGVVCRREVDACPAGNVAHRGNQPRVPGGCPGRQQCIGLRLIQPGGKIMEGMAGKENGDAVGVHAAEFTESGKRKVESQEGRPGVTTARNGEKATATRLLPSRRRVPCNRHPSARASPTPGQVQNLPPRGAGDGTRLTPLAHHS